MEFTFQFLEQKCSGFFVIRTRNDSDYTQFAIYFRVREVVGTNVCCLGENDRKTLEFKVKAMNTKRQELKEIFFQEFGFPRVRCFFLRSRT